MSKKYTTKWLEGSDNQIVRIQVYQTAAGTFATRHFWSKKGWGWVEINKIRYSKSLSGCLQRVLSILDYIGVGPLTTEEVENWFSSIEFY